MVVQSRIAAVAVPGIVLLLAACSNSSGPGSLPSCGAHGSQLTLAPAAYASIDPATDSGCVTFAANASTIDSAEYLVVPQSGSGSAGASASFALKSATPLTAMVMPQMALMSAGTHRSSALAFDRFLREMGRTRSYPRLAPSGAPSASAPIASAAAGPPIVGSLRSFKVCSDFTCSSFTQVAAKAQSVGMHIAIYVDTLAPSPGLSTSDLDSLKQLFDTRLYPLDTATFGHVSDIDNNTVVIVLMTNVVNKLVSKTRCLASGFIAGFFFAGDLDPTFSTQFNNGEIFYSIVADPNGTLSCAHSAAEVRDGTGVTFTHEFQHMINFVEHVRVRGGQEEEGWLDEGLSKYAEEIAGRSFLPDNTLFSRYAFNDVYDAYQYMSATGTTPLLIPADTGSLAEVGASWLFTRFIVDQFGDSLAGKLVQTTLVGSANVAAKTAQPFDVTISHWGLANWVSDLPNFTAPPQLQYKVWHFRTTFTSLNAQDPRDFPRPYPLVPPISGGSAVNLGGTLWAGSGAYVRVVQPPGGAAFTLQFSANGASPVSPAIVPRLTVIRIR